MKYVLKQKIWSFGDDFTIKTADGADAFTVDGRALSLTDKLSFQDPQGRELAFIRRKLISLGKKYEITRNGQLAAIVKKKHFTLFRAKFFIDVPGPDDLEARGDFIDKSYAFYRGKRQVAEVSKRWFAWADTYGVDVSQGEDDVLILASAVVIDLVCHDDD